MFIQLDGNASINSPGELLGRIICKRFAATLAKKQELAQTEVVTTIPTIAGSATPSFERFHPPPEPTPKAPVQAHSVPVSSRLEGPSLPKVAPKAATQPRYIPLNTWLADLNKSRRMPNDNTDYLSLLPDLLSQDVQSTFEIVLMGVEGLNGIGSIKCGTAIRLVAWAVEDRDAS